MGVCVYVWERERENEWVGVCERERDLVVEAQERQLLGRAARVVHDSRNLYGVGSWGLGWGVEGSDGRTFTTPVGVETYTCVALNTRAHVLRFYAHVCR